MASQVVHSSAFGDSRPQLKMGMADPSWLGKHLTRDHDDHVHSLHLWFSGFFMRVLPNPGFFMVFHEMPNPKVNVEN